MRFIKLLPLVLLLFDACVDPLTTPVISTTRHLVVDGVITDELGPYVVRLFLTSDLNKDLDDPTVVTNAIVKIVDNVGNEEILIEKSPGEYFTSANGIKGQVGVSYSLSITTAEGKQYESNPATMRAAGMIENIYYEYRENSINTHDESKTHDALFLYCNSKGEADSQNFLRWRWKGIFQVHTFPELVTKIDERGEKVADPLPCSGYVGGSGTNIQKVAPCTCCDCWAPYYNDNVIISDGKMTREKASSNVLIGQLPADQKLFYDKFYVELEQLSVSEDVFEFWKIVYAQQQGKEDLFQPNTVKVQGNMRCLSNPEEEVMGIFSVSSVAKASIFINRLDIPKPILRTDTIIGDCRRYLPGSSNQKPPFW